MRVPNGRKIQAMWQWEHGFVRMWAYPEPRGRRSGEGMAVSRFEKSRYGRYLPGFDSTVLMVKLTGNSVADQGVDCAVSS